MRDYKLEEKLRKEYNLVPYTCLTKEPSLSFTIYGTQEDINQLNKLITDYMERKYGK